ncbi:MAG: glucuronate isomerase [Ruminococcaceae bacterium]|nr:glucuronate isomerase [Oscillospiraceae bacterium]
MAFLDENFLLDTKTAKHLYFDVAKELPIYDYHCHLNPKEIAEDKKYNNITEIWLGGDHYKWRFMRSMGVDERYMTGDADPYEKFEKYCECIGYAFGNPLYHWSHLELQRYFGIYTPISLDTAKEIWEKANAVLTTSFSAQTAINQSNVELIGTTDDPFDTLEYHKIIKESGKLKTRVVPTFRPDKACAIESPDFKPYMEKAGVVSFEDLKDKLIKRLDYFVSMGSRISDHALVTVPFVIKSDKEISKIFDKAMKDKALTTEEVEAYRTAMLLFLAREYKKRDVVMQLHMSAIRNNNTRMFKRLGPDTGFDSIGVFSLAENLSRLLDTMEIEGNLPKTILYSLNPNDNYMLATMLGNFQGDGIKGKIQLGSAWWFNDHLDGMREQLKALESEGALAAFVGMTTDSRSFLSYPRHEYFRRILCQRIGRIVENGEFDNNTKMLDKLVADICLNNAKNYFGM